MTEHIAQTTLTSGRSPVFSNNGMVATSQPLAAQSGLQVLQEGGNAIDAAITTAAVLNVVEPQSTGIGGDMFMMYWNENEQKLYGLNGSGAVGREATWDFFDSKGLKDMPETGALSITVPGALDGWCTGLEKFGSGEMTLARLLEPAIDYAEKGFPVSPIIRNAWVHQTEKLKSCDFSRKIYLPNGSVPDVGTIFKNPLLAETFKKISVYGKDIFYRGEITKKIISYIRQQGGLLSESDFDSMRSEWVEPLKTNYRGYELYEIPPNSQGVTALICLNILENFNLSSFGYGSVEHLHLLIESMKLSFADRDSFIADPNFEKIPIKSLLEKEYSRERKKLIKPQKASNFNPGNPLNSSDTIYLTTSDRDGNVCSFINSVFQHFGSGITGSDSGVILQNRGFGFNLDRSHPNCVAPSKRPFHTIIPGFVMKDEKPFLSYGVMGGDMQAQGHVQVLSNIVDFGMDIQDAIDSPRFRFLGDKNVAIESGVPDHVLDGLRGFGHNVSRAGGYEGFGGGQGIMVLPNGVYAAGSDHRRDGCAVGF